MMTTPFHSKIMDKQNFNISLKLTNNNQFHFVYLILSYAMVLERLQYL